VGNLPLATQQMPIFLEDMIMNFKRFIVMFLVLTTFFLLTSFAVAQEEEEGEEEEVIGEKPTLQISPLTADFILDGKISSQEWLVASDSIVNLITIEPEEGEEPEGQTIVKVLVDQDYIVVLARCFDDEPNEIVSFSKVRDSELDEEENIVMLTAEDHLLVVFDTFLDGRSGYVFAVNPEGARFDGLVIEQGEDVNREWDAIWEAKTSRDNTGWSAEFRIPIKSLSFKKDLTTWGFNVQRRVQRLQETSRWSATSQDYEIYQTSRAGLVEELPEFDLGLGLSIRPTLVARYNKSEIEEDSEFKVEPSLDLTQKLGPNLLGALTVNTDFAETEVDARQTNLTRFPTFFPEKRSFFLEGSDIFEFGAGLDEETLLPFFSRRIGLFGLDEDAQSEIPINVGGKLNGRVGNTNLGALVVNTREVDSLNLGDVDEDIKVHVPQTTMGAMRIRQNILEESSIGMMGTFGDQLGRSDAWSAGIDFTYRTSNFLNEKNFSFNVWGLLNNREELEGNKSALGFRIDYPNDLVDINLTSIRIGDGFDPSLGFVPRKDIHIWDFATEVNPRPNWPGVRQMFHELSFVLFNKFDNSEWESYEVTIKPFDWLLESGDRFDASILLQGDRPPEDFEVSTDVDVPPGSYEWTRYVLGVRTADKRKIRGAIKWETGNYYNGDLNTVEARLIFKPSPLVGLELAAERNTGTMVSLPPDYEELEEFELVEKDFTEELFGARVQLNFSPDLQLSSFIQYDTESKELGTNTRMRWTFDPLGDFFIVYNHNLVRSDDDRWEFVSRQLPLKIQYTLRL
jgi:hypothetical protein